MRALAAAIVFVGATWSATAARADDEGASCAITADCAEGLRCIDGTCTSVARGKVVAPVTVRHERSAAERAWIGDGKGYVTEVVVGDVAATVTAGLLVGTALGTGQGWFAFAALFPTTLTGPIIHAANGRGGPAAISFFAWAAVPPTLGFFGFLAAFATFDSTSIDVIAITCYAVGLGAAAGLTALDAYFARTVRSRRSSPSESFSIMPSLSPSRGGFTAGIAGTF